MHRSLVEIYLKFSNPNPNPEIQPRKISDPVTNSTNTKRNPDKLVLILTQIDH